MICNDFHHYYFSPTFLRVLQFATASRIKGLKRQNILLTLLFLNAKYNDFSQNNFQDLSGIIVQIIHNLSMKTKDGTTVEPLWKGSLCN